jgi:hypothetical protein
LDDNWFLDVEEKVRAAAQELARAKPHLAKRQPPRGDVGQGAREEPAEVMDLFSRTLREAAG